MRGPFICFNLYSLSNSSLINSSFDNEAGSAALVNLIAISVPPDDLLDGWSFFMNVKSSFRPLGVIFDVLSPLSLSVYFDVFRLLE